MLVVLTRPRGKEKEVKQVDYVEKVKLKLSPLPYTQGGRKREKQEGRTCDRLRECDRMNRPQTCNEKNIGSGFKVFLTQS